MTIPDTAKRRTGDIMTTDLIVVGPATTVGEVARLMAEHDISGIPVVDGDNHVLGVVTDLDMMVRNTEFTLPNFIMILDSIIYLETPHHFQERLKHTLGVIAEDIMSDAVTTTPDSDTTSLSKLMVERKVNPVLVVEDGELVGLISRSDIIRLMAEEAVA